MRGDALCEDVWTCCRPPGGPLRSRRAPPPGAAATAPRARRPLPARHAHERRAADATSRATTSASTWRRPASAPGASTTGRTPCPPSATPRRTSQALARVDRATSSPSDAAWAAGFVRGADPGRSTSPASATGAALAYDARARGDRRSRGSSSSTARAGGRRERRRAAAPPSTSPAAVCPSPERQRLLHAVIADPRDAVAARRASRPPAPRSPTSSTPRRRFGGQGGLANDARRRLRHRACSRACSRATTAGGRAPRSPARAAPRRGRTLPVLAFASTNMGPAWVERVRSAAQAFGGERATVRELAGYGHLDVLVGAHRRPRRLRAGARLDRGPVAAQ